MKIQQLIIYGLAIYVGYLIATCIFNMEGMDNLQGDPPTRKCSEVIASGEGGCAFYNPKPGVDICEVAQCAVSGYCAESEQNCKDCGGTYCGVEPKPCEAPCMVKYTPCTNPSINQGVIDNIRKPDIFIKVVYISAWVIQGTFTEWKKHFQSLIEAGYNVIIISFLPQNSQKLNIPNWDILSCEEKTGLKKYLASNFAVLLLSIGGGAAPPPQQLTSGDLTYNGDWGGEKPCRFEKVYKDGVLHFELENDPDNPRKDCCYFSWLNLKTETGENYIAKYAYDQLFDGVDLDLEWFSDQSKSKSSSNPDCSSKLAEQVDTIRDYYKSKGITPIITSAPQTPYFTTDKWAIDYGQLEKGHSESFDWYNIQFYNNNNGNTKESTIGEGNNAPPETAVYIVNRGIPTNKIVLGKCGKGGNCCNPSYYVSGSDLIDWAGEYHFKGIMYWSYLGACTPEATDWLRG